MCAFEPSGEQENRPGSESNELSNPAAKKNAVQGEEGHQVPIDCPLRKKGIDPHNHKPFKEIEAYIAFLEREDRAEWQKPLQVIEALKLKGDERILDMRVQAADFNGGKLPEGRVIAADTEPDMVKYIHHKSRTSGIENIEAMIDRFSRCPRDLDAIFIAMCSTRGSTGA